MHELYELKEKLMDNLSDYSKKEMTASNLEIVDKLTHTIKNLCKIIEDTEYSEMDGSSYARRGGRYSRTGMVYADGRGRGINAPRDTRGRYSSNDGLVGELRELMEEAPDQKTRMELERFIHKMESMG